VCTGALPLAVDLSEGVEAFLLRPPSVPIAGGADFMRCKVGGMGNVAENERGSVIAEVGVACWSESNKTRLLVLSNG
jgi:hypothetical protein